MKEFDFIKKILKKNIAAMDLDDEITAIEKQLYLIETIQKQADDYGINFHLKEQAENFWQLLRYNETAEDVDYTKNVLIRVVLLFLQYRHPEVVEDFEKFFEEEFEMKFKTTSHGLETRAMFEATAQEEFNKKISQGK